MNSDADRTVNYVVSRFPKVTETFIANEITSVAAHNLDVTLFSLVRTDELPLHESSSALVDGLVAGERRVGRLARAQLHWLRRRPRVLLTLWGQVIWAHRRHPGVLARTLYSTALGGYWAERLAGAGHLHVHWATYPAHIAWVTHRLTGQRYTLTAHAHDIQLPNPMLRTKLRDAAGVVTISEFNRRALVELVGPEFADRIHVIHCGVASERFAQRPPRPSPDGSPTLVCVASFMDYKGHDVLLDAVALLRDRGRPVRLRLVGDGELRGAIEERVVRLGLGDQVELLGWRSAAEVAEIVAGADAFVLASVVSAGGQTEGIPVALMEAMAVGVPVVASRVSGIPELVIDGVTGTLAAPGDAADVARAIESVLDDPMRSQALADAGVRLVRTEFDHERSVGRLVELFESIAGMRPAAGVGTNR